MDNLSQEERLRRISKLVLRGIYLYIQKNPNNGIDTNSKKEDCEKNMPERVISDKIADK